MLDFLFNIYLGFNEIRLFVLPDWATIVLGAEDKSRWFVDGRQATQEEADEMRREYFWMNLGNKPR